MIYAFPMMKVYHENASILYTFLVSLFSTEFVLLVYGAPLFRFLDLMPMHIFVGV